MFGFFFGFGIFEVRDCVLLNFIFLLFSRVFGIERRCLLDVWRMYEFRWMFCMGERRGVEVVTGFVE